MQNEKISFRKYDDKDRQSVIDFLRKCLPQSGRELDIDGRHKIYRDIDRNFELFLCMREGEMMIGTVAVKRLDSMRCELKSLYLSGEYHGKGLGYRLLEQSIKYAREKGCSAMYLDSLSASVKALALYRKAGFLPTERYNDNPHADVFMVIKL